MKRNLISELQQRSLSIFLKCRAPCAAARSLAANGRSPPRDPPTAASPASWGAATPPSAPAWPHVALPTAATRNRAGQVPWPPIRSSGHSMPSSPSAEPMETEILAPTILGAFEEARSQLIGRSVVLTDGKAGTVENVW